MKTLPAQLGRRTWCYHPERHFNHCVFSQTVWDSGSTHIILRNGEEFTADMDMPWSLCLFMLVRLPYRFMALCSKVRAFFRRNH